MVEKTIIYVGNFLLPNKDAAAQLVQTNVRILEDLGYNVILIGKDDEFNSRVTFIDTKIVSNNISYKIPFPKKINEQYYSLRRYSELIDFLTSSTEKIEAIICYGSPATTALLIIKLKRWCKKNRIPFIANIADISAFTHGNWVGRFFKRINYIVLRKNFKYDTDYIIAVSKYIRDYYMYQNKIISVIPPLVDAELLPKPTKSTHDKINLVYAGVPFPVDGRKVDVTSYKDRLDIAIELLSEIYKKNQNFVLNIYGINKNEYLRVVKDHQMLLDEINGAIVFHGKTNHHEILEIIARADFTINLRDINQMTSAGFSTKFVESISCGTPTITTNTSDLSDYMVEGKNGFFINIVDRDAALNKMCEILEITKEEIFRMKMYCYDSKIFDYRNYVDRMREVLVKSE